MSSQSCVVSCDHRHYLPIPDIVCHPINTSGTVVIYLPAQPHQHHREERPCGDIDRKRTDLSVSQSATRDLSPRHVRLEDTVKHISHRHHDRRRVGSVRVSD